MTKKQFDAALVVMRANPLKALFWLLGILMMLLRANIKLLLGFNRPCLIFAGRMTHLEGFQYISIGSYARIANYCRITAWNGGVLKIGNNFSLGEYSIIENGFNIAAEKGVIELGNNIGIGAFSFISCPSRLRVGNDCIIGQYFSIHAQNHNFSGQQLIRLQGTSEIGVEIGNNCWIGAKVTILDGVTIGSGCVIAAGAVVTRSFPDKSVIGGVPARLLTQRD
jgi:acetyltransferase-like isoleucine patch superfamily enzyme